MTQNHLQPPGIDPAQARAARERAEAISRAAELQQMLSTLEKVDDQGRRGTLLDNVCSKEDVLDLPVHPNPPGINSGELKVDLLKHQVSTSGLYTLILTACRDRAKH